MYRAGEKTCIGGTLGIVPGIIPTTSIAIPIGLIGAAIGVGLKHGQKAKQVCMLCPDLLQKAQSTSCDKAGDITAKATEEEGGGAEATTAAGMAMLESPLRCELSYRLGDW